MRVATTKTVENTTIICDFCGLARTRIKLCSFCGKDICYKCAILHDLTSCLLEEDNYSGDYPDYICRPCWDRGEEIRKSIDQIRKSADQKEEELMSKWKEACKQKQEDK